MRIFEHLKLRKNYYNLDKWICDKWKLNIILLSKLFKQF